ncbi:uncharacterized protein AKAW2_31504S [Aspergillus luchuensis]|uniref:Uncharacterized protein n=1 Tax=Aspergillus kawachii TaxID=1069201 RepID=A0A7R7W892_ASPKA|nr:uncharacterized protein AKAW2_31504S [Aspergillus luchuensis]KAI2812368.1 hypothetical protein CBS115989_10525 [Aspergillus niger]KAI2834792.1 hypothetical protein CBS11232_10724 [Aspergillus niger]KAI2868317.1 hypothetical protein CBS115988_10782 [Aspergillus niger]BCR98185.1 hypothetical protein AKAW2_31504S [Aspergillus luchuensis]
MPKRSFSQLEGSSLYENSRGYLESVAKETINIDEVARAKCKELMAELDKHVDFVLKSDSQTIDEFIRITLGRASHLEYLQRVAHGQESQIIRERRSFYGNMLYNALLVQAHEYGGLRLGRIVIISITPNKLFSLRHSIHVIIEHIQEVGQRLRHIEPPKTFFNRLAHESQKRWSSSGEVIEETLEDVGLSQEALEWVKKTKEQIAQSSQPQALNDISDVDILRLLCWMIPRENAWEPGVNQTRKDLGPFFIEMARRVRASDLPERDKCAVVEAIVAVVQSNHSFAEALDLAVRLLEHSNLPRYLHGLVALQKSNLYRLNSSPEKSEEAISKYYCDTKAYENERRTAIATANDRRPKEMADLFKGGMEERLAAVEDSLWRSHLENLVQQENYSRALLEATARPFQPRCQMGRLLSPHISITMGKIFIVHGRHQSAQTCFEGTLFEAPMYAEQVKTLRLNIVCRLADVYCDLNKPAKALRLLKEENRKLIKDYQPQRKAKRLLLALVDAYLADGCYIDALSTLCDSRLDFHKENKDITDQFMHVRCQFARARLHCFTSRFEDGYREWVAALALVEKYPDFEDEGFAAGICQLSMAWACLELGDRDSGYSAFMKAKTFLENSPPNYWLPTIQKSWFDYVSEKLHQKAGWPPIQQHSPRPTPPVGSHNTVTPPSHHLLSPESLSSETIHSYM